MHAEIVSYCGQTGKDASSFAFEGGEDYALAGTCPADAWPQLEVLLSGFSVPAWLIMHALLLGLVKYSRAAGVHL